MIDDKTFYYLQRRKKRLTLKVIAEGIGCSDTLLCKYENNKVNMSDLKVEKYKKYIDEY